MNRLVRQIDIDFRGDSMSYFNMRNQLGIRDNRIALITHNYSGSNSLALYKFLMQKKPTNVEFRLVSQYSVMNDKDTKDYIASSKVVFTTFVPFKFSKEQICVQSWHGFPLKTLGLLDLKDEKNLGYILEMISKTDIVLSYSSLYTTLFNSCFPLTYDNYAITGMPRNDFLFLDRETSVRNLAKITRLREHDLRKSQIIFYMPSYRVTKYRTDRQETLSIVEETFFNEEFKRFLERENYFLIIKLHPFEDSKAYEMMDRSPSKRIAFVTDSELEKNFLDFYELLPAGDILITDYSSVYFDWLLLNRPIIFFVPDIEVCTERRDFLLEPLDIWMPGPICHNTNELIRSISEVQKDTSSYASNRKFVTESVHEFRDNKSSERVWNLFQELLSGSRMLPKSKLVYKNLGFSPVNAISYEYLEKMLLEGRFEEVIKLLTEETNPTEYYQFMALAISYLNLGLKEEALKNIEKARTLKPEDGEVLVNYSEILYLNNKLSQAAEIAIQALEYVENDSHLYDILYDFTSETGEHEIALNFAHLAAASAPDNETKSLLSNKYKLLKNKRKVIIVFGELVNPELLYGLVKKGFEIIIPYLKNSDPSNRTFVRSLGATMVQYRNLFELLNQKEVSAVLCFGNAVGNYSSPFEISQIVRCLHEFTKTYEFLKTKNPKVVSIYGFNSKISLFEDQTFNSLLARSLSNVDLIIFPTENMKNYFESRFPELSSVKKQVMLLDTFVDFIAPSTESSKVNKFYLALPNNLEGYNPLPKANFGKIDFDLERINKLSFWSWKRNLKDLANRLGNFVFGLGYFGTFYTHKASLDDILTFSQKSSDMMLTDSLISHINHIINVPQDVLLYLALGLVPIVPENENDFYSLITKNGMAISIPKDCEYFEHFTVSETEIEEMRKNIRLSKHLWTTEKFLKFFDFLF
jgi:CDP-glycerol glycerophosphotransferase (TagB/SpsB family)/tetratricopeptide (TPR) repeat protein